MSGAGFSPTEMMVVAAARELAGKRVCFVGVGLPNIAVNLAQRTVAPDLELVYEAGVFGARPARLPLSIGDPTIVTGSTAVVSVGRAVPAHFVTVVGPDGEALPVGWRVTVGFENFATAFGDERGVPGVVEVNAFGGDLQTLRADQPVRAVVSGLGARIRDITTERLPQNGHWRVRFTVQPTGGRPVDLRCYLELYGAPLSETWTYQWTPGS